MIFKDRKEAGEKLAIALSEYKNHSETKIIALPRGGVIVGFEIAKALNTALDIVCVRKIGAPFNPEFAIGAITETGVKILSDETIQALGISAKFLEEAIEKEQKEALSRLQRYRKNKPARNLQGKIVILVDDGLATGSTMLAAIKTVKAEKAKEVIVALPVAAPDSLAKIQSEVDKIICLLQPDHFFAVGQFYENFDQVTDEEVKLLL